MLDGGWSGVHDELVIGVEGGCDGVLGKRCEVNEQALEAVDREAVWSRAVGLFADGGWRSLRLGDDAGPQGFGGLLVGVVIEHRGEALAHVPFDVVGEHAQTDVGAHARSGPMEDRPHLEVDSLELLMARSTWARLL